MLIISVLKAMVPLETSLDGEKISTIFFIKNPYLTIHFSNLTFINGKTSNFGGAICIETGNVYVDNCIFINNTALVKTNAGAISNYGDEEHKSYLFVNNSLFLGNHVDHDGGAVTTCYANSDIYNSVFINNSARRDGGAIRVSIFGYGNVQDCIFIYNHADEWGGAYYSWAGNSNIKRCIFLNNTAGTNGGAVMVSGNLNLTDSIIINNTAYETGGSFYIQQQMFDAVTVIKVEGNIITNNTAPLGEEIFVKWDDTRHLFPKFNNNNWGTEDPSSPSLIDPNNVSTRIHPTTTTNDDSLLYNLNFGLLSKYYDILNKYYSNFSEDFNVKIRHNKTDSKNETKLKFTNNINSNIMPTKNKSIKISMQTNNKDNVNTDTETINPKTRKYINNKLNYKKKVNANLGANSITNSTLNNNNNKKSVEVFKDTKNLSKSLKSFDSKYLVGLGIIFLVLIFGFLKRKDNL